MEISKEFLKLIMDCDLLSRCGKKDDLGFDVEYVDSETKAKKMINSIKWENMYLEVSGDFTEFLSRNHKDIFNKNWNGVVRQIKSNYMNEIQTKVEMNWKDEKTKQRVIDDVQFNILTLFMLDYYSDYYQSEFFDRMLKIYLAGHFPCGWSGSIQKENF